MQLTITGVDYVPEELYEQTQLVADLMRELPGPDRPDYWLAKLRTPVTWLDDNIERQITHVVVTARWVGTQIGPGVENLRVDIAYVTDDSQIADSVLDFSKCKYVAIGLASETGGHRQPKKLEEVMAGAIGRAFGSRRRGIECSHLPIRCSRRGLNAGVGRHGVVLHRSSRRRNKRRIE